MRRPDILTVYEAAPVLDLSPLQVRNIVKAHKLRAVSGPGPLRVRIEDVLALRRYRAEHPTRGGRPRVNPLPKLKKHFADLFARDNRELAAQVEEAVASCR